MPHLRIAILAMSLLCLAAASPFEDTGILDQQVAGHLNANIGDIGGARALIDRRLKLKRCPGSPELSDTNKGAVMISCRDLGWRIYVPVRREASQSKNFMTSADTYVVQRNEPVTLVVRRANFSIRYDVVAQQNGRLGEFIPVRATRKSKEVMARVSGSGEVELTR